MIRPYLAHSEIVDSGSFENTSPVVRFIYNSAFAFEDGDVARPRLAAGVTLRALFRFIGYPDSVLYRMTGSMGDIVIAPLYEVLASRGVKFRFFHAVEKI